MESTTTLNYIHRALRGWGYAFKHRGEMEVKGKGVMSTYFLCGYLDRRLKEPQDAFTDLAIFQDGTENEDYTEWPRTGSQDNLDKVGQKGDDHLCEPHHDGVQSSDIDIQYDERLISNSNEDLDQNPLKASYIKKNHIQPSRLQHFGSDSSHSLTNSNSQRQISRRKKLSNSSHENVCLFQALSSISTDVSNEVHPIRRKSIIVTKSVSTQTTVSESGITEDCLYINGSFKNEFRGRNYTASRDCYQPCASREESLSPEPVIHVTIDPHSKKQKEERPTREDDEKRTQKHSEIAICDNPNSQSTILTSYEKEKSGVLTISLDCMHSAPRLETFSLSTPRSPLHQVRPSSSSIENLKRLDTDGKSRRAKKHRSKLCSIV